MKSLVGRIISLYRINYTYCILPYNFLLINKYVQNIVIDCPDSGRGCSLCPTRKTEVHQLAQWIHHLQPES